MNKLFTLKATLVAVAILVLPMAHAATMSKADYVNGKTRISVEGDTHRVRACCLTKECYPGVFVVSSTFLRSRVPSLRRLTMLKFGADFACAAEMGADRTLLHLAWKLEHIAGDFS